MQKKKSTVFFKKRKKVGNGGSSSAEAVLLFFGKDVRSSGSCACGSRMIVACLELNTVNFLGQATNLIDDGADVVDRGVERRVGRDVEAGDSGKP